MQNATHNSEGPGGNGAVYFAAHGGVSLAWLKRGPGKSQIVGSNPTRHLGYLASLIHPASCDTSRYRVPASLQRK